MNKPDLHEKFVSYLTGKFSKHSELVYFVADKLNIEKESASRRLSGKVNFSIREMGILAREFNMSLDRLLYQDHPNYVMLFQLDYPRAKLSFDVMIGFIEQSVENLRRMSKEATQIGMVFDSLPIEFFAPYPDLCRFLYFKWGYYFIGGPEFKQYASWQIPPRLEALNKEMLGLYGSYESAVYIWDNSVIWNLANEIRFMLEVNVITREDTEAVKADIFRLLNDLEKVASGEKAGNIALDNSDFHTSAINIGITVAHIKNENKAVCFLKNSFFHTYASENPELCEYVAAWIESMKKITTLISGSGEKERMLYFRKQHEIVEEI